MSNQSGVGVRTNDSLRLRSAPGTQSEILAVVPQGTALTATAINPERMWVTVNYNGQDGWLALELLAVESGSLADLPTSSATFTLSGGGVPVTVGATVSGRFNVRMRGGPGDTFPVHTAIDAGIAFPVVGLSPDSKWLQTTYNGQTGWVFAELVQVIGSAPAAPAAPPPPPPDTARGLTAEFSTEKTMVVQADNEPAWFNFRIHNTTLGAIPWSLIGVTAEQNGVPIPSLFQTSWSGQGEIGPSMDMSWRDRIFLGSPGTYILRLTYRFADTGETVYLGNPATVTVVPAAAAAASSVTTVPAVSAPAAPPSGESRGLEADFSTEKTTVVQADNEPAWFNFRIRNTTSGPIPWSLIGVTAEQNGVPIPSLFQTSWSGQDNFNPGVDMTWRDRIFLGGPGAYVLRLTVRFADTGQTIYLGQPATVTVV